MVPSVPITHGSGLENVTCFDKFSQFDLLLNEALIPSYLTIHGHAFISL